MSLGWDAAVAEHPPRRRASTCGPHSPSIGTQNTKNRLDQWPFAYQVMPAELEFIIHAPGISPVDNS
ncbi:hypothetical protein [Kocuria sp.]|uniref:hypothetical protein n=1 Tax=Kocuria sp. TaxID=1871328 RepID=UPI0026DFBF82|nr:hypothetical protein [Kocuria sp.]MDO5617691.1 hypothetical protein [Kocuria sp.]